MTGRAPAPAPAGPPPTAEALWQGMPEDVRFVLRRRIAEEGPLEVMRRIGRHWRAGQWSITPWPGTVAGLGTIGLEEAAILVQRLQDDG